MELTRGRATLGPLATLVVLASLAACALEVPSAAAPPQPPGQSAPVPKARVGTPAPSARVHFVPAAVVLPGGSQAPVEPAQTVDGELVVPEDVRQVGWWDGSAEAGAASGTTVIAGHVDSATQGLGFFARLLRVQRGEVVTLRDGDHQQRYRVTSVRTVAQQALATSGSAFDQDGDHRLVLITCTGRYLPERGGYESNLVVTAEPLGLAR